MTGRVGGRGRVGLGALRRCALVVGWLVLSPGPAAGVGGAAPCPPDDRGARPLLVAQLTPVGQAENALGTLVIRRADGRVDSLRGRGTLQLWEGDELRTERGSKAFLRLADGTQLAMNEQTTFLVRARTERDGGLVRLFRLLVGEIWMKSPGPVPIEVETPAATAAIKGTEFNLRVLPDGQSVLTVLQGLVQLRNESCSPCAVSAAAQSSVQRGRPCVGATTVDPAPVIAWIAGVVR